MFRGLSAFPLTPADADGRVDTAALQRLLVRLADARVDSVGLLGSTGTYAYLTRAERGRAVAAAVECLHGRVPLVVGVGALRTDAAVALARDAEAAGADGLLLAPVSYTPLLDAEVFAHVEAVAAATALPICLYDNPATTRFSFAAQLVVRLAALPDVVAIKRPPPTAALRAVVPPDFAVGFSGDWLAADALLDGAAAWYSVVAGLLPVPALALTRAAMAGDAAETVRIDATFAPLWALFQELSSLRVSYAMAALLGLTEALPPRPILPLSAADETRVAHALEALATVA